MEPFERATGANASEQDPRTVKHEDLAQASTPLVSGGVPYLPADIEDQHNVGICTAISFIQNREKVNGKKYSPDFQYLLQKKYIDQAWFEGSSIFAALKVGKTYGLLPLELWTHTTEADRRLSYADYSAKLQAIPLEEILRLIALCTDKIAGYASVNVSDPQAIAKAVNESEAGILCRYGCQKNWWTSPTGQVSWQAKDINPLRPGPETSGHAITLNMFDYSSGTMQKLANTWGIYWNLQGSADINWDNYKMNEAWLILKVAPIINQYPTIRIGAKGAVVKDLQTKLNAKAVVNYSIAMDGVFGPNTQKVVVIFQTKNGLTPDGIVGPKTWAALNT